MPAPGSEISVAQAAHILDVSQTTVRRWITEGLLDSSRRPYVRVGVDRDHAEQLAALRWTHQKGGRLADDSYWVTAPVAARILQVTRARVGQLVAKGRLPYVQAACGVRLFRRYQLEVIANARIARRLASSSVAAG